MPRLTAGVEVTTTKTVTIAPQVRKKLKTNLDAYADLKLQRDAIDHAMTKHKDTVSAIMADLGEDSLSMDGYKTTIVVTKRSKLDEKRLLLSGVSMAQIEAATVETLTKPYLKVTCPGVGADAGD